MNDAPIILGNQCFVPAELLSRDDLMRWRYEWTEIVKTDRLDEKGEIVMTKAGRPAVKTERFTRTLKTYESVYNHDQEWIALPRGNMAKIRAVLREHRHRIIDIRCREPLGFDLEMLEETRRDPRWAAQHLAVAEWAKTGQGIVTGGTGSGKTIVGMSAIATAGLKTLIVSARRDGNDHWITQLRKRTNLSEMEETYGRDLAGVYKVAKNMTWPITVVTVQSFIALKGHGRLADFQFTFGMVLADEVHEFGSELRLRTLGCMNPRAFLGLTATPDRKDNRHHFIDDVVGPVITHLKSRQMKPKVTFILTGVTAPEWIYQKPYPNYYRWNQLLNHICRDDGRYDIIMRYLRRDIDKGRVIACVSDRKVIPQILHSKLVEEGYDVAYVDGNTRNRKAIYDSIRNGKVRVLCAGKVLNALVDIPNLDCLHLLTPLNNAKDVKQVYGRSSRWMEGKKKPLVRDYVDQGGQLSGAYANRTRICLENGWQTRVEDGTERQTKLFDRYR